MTILNFDEINKYTQFKAELEAMPKSEVMEKKKEIRDGVWDLLEYAYMLGYSRATEEIDGLANDFIPFLPDDYMDRAELFYGYDEEKRDEAIWQKVADKDFSQRILEHAEVGDVPSIIRVVQTDGDRLYNTGGYDSAKVNKASTKTWNTMLDDRVRDTHDYLEGMTVGIDERFYTFDGDSARFPGDFSLPENVIGCRCTISYGK